MDAVVSRQCWRATDPVHAQVSFAPEPKEELAALGHDLTANPAAGCFVPRSAAFGAVGPGAVVASLFTFAPAVLVAEGVSGLEAAVLHVAQGDAWTREPLRKRRGWSAEQWDDAVERLRARGWLDESERSIEQGAAARAHVEARTDALSLPAWERLGEQDRQRLRALVRPLSTAVVEAGGIEIE